MIDPALESLEDLIREAKDTLEVETYKHRDSGHTTYDATIRTAYGGTSAAEAKAQDEFTALIRLKYVLDAQHQERVKLVEDRIEEIQRKTRKEKLEAILQAKREAESNPLSKCLHCGRARTGNPQGWEQNPRCNECLHERAALSAEARGPVVISEACIRGYRTITPIHWCPTCYPLPKEGSILSPFMCSCGNQKRLYRPTDTIT